MQTTTVYDKGPADKPYDEPVATVMATVDAKHAVAVDPDRYSMEPVPAPVPNLGLEDRVALLERRLDALEARANEVPQSDPLLELPAPKAARPPKESA